MATGIADVEQKPKGALITRFTVESLLEEMLGAPRLSLRDAHTELVMVDRQRALLAQAVARRPADMFLVEEVELLLDAIEEYGACTIPSLLFGGDGWARDFAPPPLSAREMRLVIDVCALSLTLDSDDFVAQVDDALRLEQMRLRAAFVAQSRTQRPPK
jgi:hypothetical protein